MKARPLRFIDGNYEECSVREATFLELHMPGPLPKRVIPVICKGRRENTGCWTWNGSVEAPTLRPSILSSGTSFLSDGEHRCHSWVNDGSVIFLDDCSHDLAGKTMDLLDVECINGNCIYCGELLSGIDVDYGREICGQCRDHQDEPTTDAQKGEV